MKKENTLKAKQLLKTEKEKESAEQLARTYIRNKGTHYSEIVRETGIFWQGYIDDCLKAAENECLKSGNSLERS